MSAELRKGEVELVCPKCGAGDLELTEALIGGCRSTFFRKRDGKPDVEPHGYTEVYWDSSESVGIFCKACTDWSHGTAESPDYEGALKQLVTRLEFEAKREGVSL